MFIGLGKAKSGVKGINSYQGKILNVSVKNENILARDGSGKAVVTVPDLICLVDLDTMMPLTNAETKEGQNVVVFGVTAPAKWHEDPMGFGCWKHILKKLDYDGEYVPA